MNRSLRCWPLVLWALLTGCSDSQKGPPIEQPTRCGLTQECGELQVCREGICVEAPSCAAPEECSLGEGCLDGRCAYDPDACVSDGDCADEGDICDEGRCRLGCRTPADCIETETCGSEFVCVRRPCTEVPCDEGYDCLEDTGECQLRPCNGGCDAPLICRESDDTCVECFGDNDCDALVQFCADDGFCANEACDVHADCPEGTFCIEEACRRPPECEDDSFEEDDAWPDGIRIPEGEHSGYVSCPYDDDFHPFVASGDRSMTVELEFDRELGNLDFEVLNTVGVTFGRADSEGEGESLTLNLYKTGEYSIRVYQPDGGTQGIPYTLRVSTGQSVEVAPDECLADGFEPNDTQATATRLFTGRWTGPTVCAGDQDYYLLPALAGELYRVCLTPSELFGVPLGLEVLDHEGVPLLEGAGMAHFCVEEDLLFGDDYVTHVFGLEPDAESPYHLELYVEPGCRLYDDEYDQEGLNNRLPREGEPPLVMLDEDTPYDLRVCPNNPDYWPVPLLRRDVLVANISYDHTEGDLQMRLLRPSGTVILSSTGTGDSETINYQAELDGTHYLRVYGEGEDSGEYTFLYSVTKWCQVDALEDNDAAGEAAAVALGDTTSLWRCAGDDDFFSYTIPADVVPTALEVRIDYAAGDGTLELEVTPPGGEAVAGAAETGARVARLDAGLTAGGEYLIRVYGAEQAQNTYTLNVALETE